MSRIEDGGPAEAGRPILFSAPMVRALLAGTKTQTRRLAGVPSIEEVPGFGWHVHNKAGGLVAVDADDIGAAAAEMLPIQPHDRLWVREAWSGAHAFRDIRPSDRMSYSTPDGPVLREDVWFWADGNPDGGDYERPRPSIHMPRWASRLTLTVTDVRVERLQDISEADAIAEGAWHWAQEWDHAQVIDHPRDAYCHLWEMINGEGSWRANPWVAAYTFTVHHENISRARAAVSNATTPETGGGE